MFLVNTYKKGRFELWLENKGYIMFDKYQDIYLTPYTIRYKSGLLMKFTSCKDDTVFYLEIDNNGEVKYLKEEIKITKIIKPDKL